MRLGDYELHLVSDGTMMIDGGAIFGVVPRAMWERWYAPDERNRILLGLNCLLVRAPSGRRILIESGIGEGISPDEATLHSLARPNGGLAGGLRRVGVEPQEIDVVILTHLHFDHMCGLIAREGGKAVPAFPRARHLVAEGEWRVAFDPDPRSRPSYRAQHLEMLDHAGLIERIAPGLELEPGLRLLATPGHTKHHLSVLTEADGQKVFFAGDVFPTAAHLTPHYTMSYELYPLELMETRARLLERIRAEDWIVVFSHDPQAPAARVGWKNGKPHAVPAPELRPV